MNNYKNFFEKDLAEQIKIIDTLHNIDLRSVVEIAELLETYPNRIRRWAIKAEFNLRGKSDAQRVALETGKLAHPTKGKKRTDDEKNKIRKKMASYWSEMSEEDMEHRKELARENWANMSDEDKRLMQKQAAKGRIEAAKFGSKLEKIVLEILQSKGYGAIFHKEHSLLNTRLHLDIVVPELMTAIEIDGPTHFMPIWGEEHLRKTQETDNNKDGLLLNAGYNIVRIRQTKNLCKRMIDKISKALVELLDKIKVEKTNSRFIIGD
jgi:very-short-patch-repair endonuclease